MKRILILGGTRFIGRNLVNRLLDLKDFEVTLFNRNITNPDLFPGVQQITGDRNTDDIYKISESLWDFVIDLSCYFPESLDRVIHNLRSKPEKYIFISTCSVYENSQNKSLFRKESAKTLNCSREQAIDEDLKFYGNRKAECERILTKSGIQSIILRPALVYGPYDPTDRLYYWLYQIKNNNDLLVPGKGNRIFSITYVIDLIETIVKSMTLESTDGIYNMISTNEISIGKIVKLVKGITDRNPPIYNASPSFLKSRQINEWIDIPLWLEADHFTYSNQKWLDDFQLTPTTMIKGLSETVNYYGSMDWPEPGYGINDTLKNELLKKLKG